jgi:hypothetical protein
VIKLRSDETGTLLRIGTEIFIKRTDEGKIKVEVRGKAEDVHVQESNRGLLILQMSS